MTESDAPLNFRQILFSSDGTRTPRARAVQQFGERVVVWAELIEALTLRDSAPRRLKLPQRIFVSYRWGTTEENQWVADLVAALEARGNIVVFDQALAKGSPDISVVDVVSKMADTSLVLMVIDPGYISRVGSPEQHSHAGRQLGWAWDEYFLCQHLTEEIKIGHVGFLRAGNELPRGMTLITRTKSGNTFDVRTPAKLEAVLQQYFRSVAPAAPALAAQAATLLRESEAASQSNELERAHEFALAVRDLVPNAPDGHLRVALTSLRLGRAREAYGAVVQALEIDPTWTLLRYLEGEAACACGESEAGIRRTAPMMKLSPSSWRLHLVLAHGLAELGQYGSARAHRDRAFELNPKSKCLEIPSCCSDPADDSMIAAVRECLETRGTIGITQLVSQSGVPTLVTTHLEPESRLPDRVGAVDFDLALVCSLSQSSALRSLDEVVTEWHLSCSDCRVQVCVEHDFLCIMCGAQHDGNLIPCSCCGNRDFVYAQHVLVAKLRCPFCGSGHLTTE